MSAIIPFLSKNGFHISDWKENINQLIETFKFTPNEYESKKEKSSIFGKDEDFNWINPYKSKLNNDERMFLTINIIIYEKWLKQSQEIGRKH